MTKRPSFEGFSDPKTNQSKNHPTKTEAEIERDRITIRTANDVFRRTLTGGDIFTTPGINTLGIDANLEILTQIRQFTDFHSDNDPYGEHDFGSIVYNQQKLYWKIDYYDNQLHGGSPDPANREPLPVRCFTFRFWLTGILSTRCSSCPDGRTRTEMIPYTTRASVPMESNRID